MNFTPDERKNRVVSSIRVNYKRCLGLHCKSTLQLPTLQAHFQSAWLPQTYEQVLLFSVFWFASANGNCSRRSEEEWPRFYFLDSLQSHYGLFCLSCLFSFVLLDQRFCFCFACLLAFSLSLPPSFSIFSSFLPSFLSIGCLLRGIIITFCFCSHSPLSSYWVMITILAAGCWTISVVFLLTAPP